MNSELMRRAIAVARTNNECGGHAIGAVVARGSEIIAEGVTTTRLHEEPLGHAEANAIRDAAQKLGTRYLVGCQLYTTFEPCPMCASAAIWAKIDTIVYGANRNDRNEIYRWCIEIPAAEVAQRSTSPIQVVGDYLREECLELLRLPVG